MSPDYSYTGLKQRSRQAAAFVRASRVRASLFVIAFFLLATYQDQFIRWKPSFLFEEQAPEFPAWRELFTWDGIVASFNLMLTWARVFLGPWTLTPLLSYVTCVLAIAWLHSVSWRKALTRLGLPRPTRVEFTIPLIACVPSFVYIMFAYGPAEMLPNPEVVELTMSYVTSQVAGLLVGSFGVMLSLGLLYRGLVQSAGWTRIWAWVALAVIPDLVSMALYGVHLFELTPWTYALLLLGGLVWLAARVWIFEQWSRRVWSLAVLSLGTSFTHVCLPWSVRIDSTFTSWTLQLAPLALLALWTLWHTKSVDPRKLAQRD